MVKDGGCGKVSYWFNAGVLEACIKKSAANGRWLNLVE
jgi:hypothetical protein